MTCGSCKYEIEKHCYKNPPAPWVLPNPINGSPMALGVRPPVKPDEKACGAYEAKRHIRLAGDEP